VAEYLEKQLHNFKAAQGKKPERDNPVMAGMVANLSPEDMRNVAAYYASQKPKGGVSHSRELVFVGQKLYRAGNATTGLPACAGCHGPNGAHPSQYPPGGVRRYTEATEDFHGAGKRHQPDDAFHRGEDDRAEMRCRDYIAGLR
jgi:cytochrome c553